MFKLPFSIMPRGGLQHFGVMEKCFDEEEVERITFFEKILNFEPQTTTGEMMNPDAEETQNYRVVNGARFPLDENTQWLFDKIFHFTAQANYDLFLYDIEFLEPPSYLIYESFGDGSFYKPHRDTKLHEYQPYDRKISATIFLSDPEEYEGGELLVDTGGGQPKENWVKIKAKKGEICFFDSTMIHEVTPVTSGIRKVIVFWIHGKNKIC